MRSLVTLAVLALVVAGLAPAKAGAAHKIYWGGYDSEVSYIRRANPDGSGVQLLVELGLDNFVNGLALHVVGGKMYWGEYQSGLIRRANLDGSGVEDLVTDIPVDLALDANHGKLYWAGYSVPAGIRRANLDGSGVENLVNTTGKDVPYSLALDLKHGKVYWGTQAGLISRANLDGSGVQVLINQGKPVYSLALDVAHGKMYWGAGGEAFIQRANLDGSGVEDVINIYGSNAIALDVGSGKIYYFDFNSYDIRRANLDGSGVEDILPDFAASSIALDLASGGEVDGFYYNNVICKPPQTRPKQRFSVKGGPGSQAFDCAAGLALSPGEELNITIRGVALDSSFGGSFVGYQPSTVICQTNGQRFKLEIPPGTSTFDCSARSLVVNPGDKLKVTIKGFVTRE
jgi:hypothetical protein